MNDWPQLINLLTEFKAPESLSRYKVEDSPNGVSDSCALIIYDEDSFESFKQFTDSYSGNLVIKKRQNPKCFDLYNGRKVFRITFEL